MEEVEAACEMDCLDHFVHSRTLVHLQMVEEVEEVAKPMKAGRCQTSRIEMDVSFLRTEETCENSSRRKAQFTTEIREKN